MIRLNRTTEYGLIALRHMSQRRQNITSAREVADQYGLPFEITAKTLQRLRDCGLIQSAQGAHGGYMLKKELEEVTLAEFLQLMEGPQAVVVCAPPMGSGHVGCECEYKGKCEIKGFMTDLNTRVFRFLSSIRLNELGRLRTVLAIGDEP